MLYHPIHIYVACAFAIFIHIIVHIIYCKSISMKYATINLQQNECRNSLNSNIFHFYSAISIPIYVPYYFVRNLSINKPLASYKVDFINVCLLVPVLFSLSLSLIFYILWFLYNSICYWLLMYKPFYQSKYFIRTHTLPFHSWFFVSSLATWIKSQSYMLI